MCREWCRVVAFISCCYLCLILNVSLFLLFLNVSKKYCIIFLDESGLWNLCVSPLVEFQIYSVSNENVIYDDEPTLFAWMVKFKTHIHPWQIFRLTWWAVQCKVNDTDVVFLHNFLWYSVNVLYFFRYSYFNHF